MQIDSLSGCRRCCRRGQCTHCARLARDSREPLARHAECCAGASAAVGVHADADHSRWLLSSRARPQLVLY
eukprot:766591-Pleurochrysis_carterae.AAC.1